MTIHARCGFGSWKIDPANVRAVYDAIESGYRHLDSATDYGNEAQAGEGIAKAIADGLCTREELWVTSKLWNTITDQSMSPQPVKSP